MKMRNFFIVGLMFALSAFMVTSCSKDTSPKRFDKIVQKGSWRVGRALFNNVNRTDVYNKQTFKFYEVGDMELYREQDTILGTWKRGDYRKPLRFYMYFPPADSINSTDYIPFQQEWIVTYLTNTEIRLEKENNDKYQIILRNRD